MEKKNFIFMLFLFGFVIAFSFMSLYLAVSLFRQIDSIDLTTTRASSTANIDLFVETAPPSAPAPSPPSGGGGGGGGVSKPKLKSDFEVEPREINLFINGGMTEIRAVKVKNIGEKDLDVKISVTGISEVVGIDNNKIKLKVGEEKVVVLSVTAPVSGVYAGRIVFEAEGLRRETFILLNVKSPERLFDVSLTVPDEYKSIESKGKLSAIVTITPVGIEEGADVTAHYVVKDFDGNTLFTDSETFFVSEGKRIIKDFANLGLKPGNYIVGVDIVYSGGFAASSARFLVIEGFPYFWLIVFILAFLLVIFAITFGISKYKRSEKLVKVRKNYKK